MKRSFTWVFVGMLVAVFLVDSAFAGIIQTDEAKKWAGENGKARQSFSFIVFGDNRPTSPTRPLPEVLDIILKEISLIRPDFAVNIGDLDDRDGADLVLEHQTGGRLQAVVRMQGLWSGGHNMLNRNI